MLMIKRYKNWKITTRFYLNTVMKMAKSMHPIILMDHERASQVFVIKTEMYLA